jgi:CheY-like chemotaxis protein
MAIVLVIDDSKLSRTMAVKALGDAGYTVVEAADGEQGITAMEQHQPDCIVTDLLMPVLDGHGFLGQIRRRGIQTPVVVLSADIQSSTREMCEELGISSFINKPIKAEELREVVRQALASARGTYLCG